MVQASVNIDLDTLAEGVDCGDIVAQDRVPRLPGDTVRLVYQRLFARAVGLTREAINILGRGEELMPNNTIGTRCYRTPTFGRVVRFMVRL